MASEESAVHPAGASPQASPLRVLADTNVLLDLLLARQPWLNQARPMWNAYDAGRLSIYLPASVLTDIFYICRKQVGVAHARQAVETCLHGFTVIAVDRTIVEAALALPGNDFEDNVQIACTQSAALDLIVTRNTTDFAHSSAPAVEPSTVVSRLGGPTE